MQSQNEAENEISKCTVIGQQRVNHGHPEVYYIIAYLLVIHMS